MKVAIVGTGSKAEIHSQMLQTIRGVDISACCDPNLVTARKLARRFNIPQIYSDIDDLLNEEEDLHAVINCTPEHVHFSVSKKIIEKELHILSEAPLASSYKKSRHLMQLAQEKQLINMLSISERASGAIDKARKTIQNGRIGRPIHIEASYLQSWLCADYWGDWKSNSSLYSQLSSSSSSYGVLGDMGTPLIHTLCEILGDIKSVNCLSKNFSKGIRGNKLNGEKLDSSDSAVLSMEFKSGAIGAVHMTRWATGCLDRLQLRIFGDEGSLALEVEQEQEPKLTICSGPNRHTGEWKELRYAEAPHIWNKFINAIRQNDTEAQPNFENACQIQHIIKKTLENEAK